MLSKVGYCGRLVLAGWVAAVLSGAPASADEQWSENGHYYRVVLVPGIRWTSAVAAANAAGGYLATCTSAEENEFVFDLLDDPQFWNLSDGAYSGGWLGGYQQDETLGPADGWAWINGEAWSFTAWAMGQPDDEGGRAENAVHYTFNDLQAGAPSWSDAIGIGSSDRQLYLGSFVVEFDSQPPGDLPSRSTFLEGIEGWATYGDARTIEWQAPGPSRRACVFLTDLMDGRNGSFVAPAQFLGNKIGAYGGAISFSLKVTEGTDLHPGWDIRLLGAGKGLFFDLPDPVVDAWTPRLAPLTVDAGWRVGAPAGDPATKEDLLAVLADLDAILINGEFHHGSDKTMLADVVLSIRPDFDRDGEVDTGDFEVLHTCQSGPMIAHNQSETCRNTDLDDDGDVDQVDFAILQRCYGGQDRPVAWDCGG